MERIISRVNRRTAGSGRAVWSDGLQAGARMERIISQVNRRTAGSGRAVW